MVWRIALEWWAEIHKPNLRYSRGLKTGPWGSDKVDEDEEGLEGNGDEELDNIRIEEVDSVDKVVGGQQSTSASFLLSLKKLSGCPQIKSALVEMVAFRIGGRGGGSSGAREPKT